MLHPAIDTLVAPLVDIADPYERSARADQLARIRYDELVLEYQLLKEVDRHGRPSLLRLLSHDPAYQALLLEAFATVVQPASIQA
jgi:hypothetical protein